MPPLAAPSNTLVHQAQLKRESFLWAVVGLSGVNRNSFPKKRRETLQKDQNTIEKTKTGARDVSSRDWSDECSYRSSDGKDRMILQWECGSDRTLVADF